MAAASHTGFLNQDCIMSVQAIHPDLNACPTSHLAQDGHVHMEVGVVAVSNWF